MDMTTKAVALRATDYKENDKMVLLYSLEYGKISVQAKGVRKAGAKLKFACDQFCFGQYELVKTFDDRFTLKTCDQLESFFSLREDVVAYYAACVVAECLVNYTEDGQSEPKIFVATLKALQAIVNGTEPLTVALKFVLDFLRTAGFGLDFSRCAACERSSLRLYLDFGRGGAVCEHCRSSDSIPVGPQTVASCKMLDSVDYDKLKNLVYPLDTLKDALLLCNKYLSHIYYPLKTVAELVKLA
ncbi:MAG: DNA repair protein RecO [Corallococcus sp.]|nr:DNA repair protein RecO [Corallococcus sp.]MCM1359831.1 DNA repair protein RecO [Corallococcus sp.]MCM1395265.1 DNA repair protein RecO [Corallococcus sp.]